MQEMVIGKNNAGQRLDRFLEKAMPLLPLALLQKYIRIKRIKCNGQRCWCNQRLMEGDVIQLYIKDEFFGKDKEGKLLPAFFQPSISILYEDENLLLVDKYPGMVVHDDETEKVNTLINHIQAYLYQKQEWNPKCDNAFAPALCNRIDRNTGGIVIVAKNAETLRIITDKIRNREITKKYLCVVVGSMAPPKGRLKCFLRKDTDQKLMSVYHRPVRGGKSAITMYRTLQTQGKLSLVEAELFTGRTHQIRASFADAGHPILGDGKYGCGKINRLYGETRQALYSYYLRFDFNTNAESLEYLRGKEFYVKRVPFAEKYFTFSFHSLLTV